MFHLGSVHDSSSTGRAHSLPTTYTQGLELHKLVLLATNSIDPSIQEESAEGGGGDPLSSLLQHTASSLSEHERSSASNSLVDLGAGPRRHSDTTVVLPEKPPPVAVAIPGR